MKKYVWTRLLKSVVSIFVVLAIVVTMVFTMIPVSNVFEKDTTVTKLKGNAKTVYKYKALDDLGYLSYKSTADMCTAKADDYDECMKTDSEEGKRVFALYEAEGYKIQTLGGSDKLAGQVIATREYGRLELIGKYFSRLFQFDHPNKIVDANNKDMKRGYYFGGSDGNWGLQCSGCEHKYQLYFNGRFPFIHSNIITLSFGKSFPTYSGLDTMDVISNQQGKNVSKEQEFPTGKVMSSPIKQESCKYKYQPDPLDKTRFTDNYSDCQLRNEAPSMINTSYIFGIISVILAYLIAVPAGISMAKNKGKLQDKIGIVYINLLIAVPSLAFIFLMKYLGFKLGLPDKFSQLGFRDVRSYIMPIIILALMSTPSLMMWIRRYMIDQSNSDYVKFAKAKGLSKNEIFNNHILKNAIIPIVNGIPSSIILAISGAVITETVFSIPGMGKMLPDAISASNNNIVITLTFIFTSLSIISVFIGDLLMTMVDPRIQLDTKKGE